MKSGPDYRIGDHTIPVIYPISPSLFPRPVEWGEKIHMSGFWFEEEPDRFTPSQELQAFLEAEADPPVYIGFGSMNGGNMSSLLAQALRAVRNCGVRAVIHLGWSGRSFPSNRTVFFTEYIPHEWLFPRVRAVVHHGGAGTTAAGLRYGLPTMTIPFAGDQLFWGELVTRAGCGPRPLPCRHLTAEAFTGGLRDLLSNETYAKNAKKLAGKLAGEHGIQSAADLIENTMRSW